MEIVHVIGDLLEMLGIFGGVALVILAGNKAKIDKMRAEREIMQQSLAPRGENTSAELQALKQQVSEMQNTSHQFDISFDEALSRMEGRVGRLETKSAAGIANAPAEATLRNGQTQ
jgi:hypothetical protein